MVIRLVVCFVLNPRQLPVTHSSFTVCWLHQRHSFTTAVLSQWTAKH